MTKVLKRHHFTSLIIFSISWFTLASIANSALIAFPMAAGVGLIPLAVDKQRYEKKRHQLINHWPEIIDNIISGLRSGLSTPETVIQLATRGPMETRAIFELCAAQLKQSGDLHFALINVREAFADPIVDQVCETLVTSRTSGGRDTTLILRTLGDFVRGDIAVRNEIRAKHGWIKNSAIIATLAPWLLLLILSSQPTTIAAFSTSTGVVVLVIGAVMSAVGFLWMTRLGRFEKIPRVFPGDLKNVEGRASK